MLWCFLILYNVVKDSTFEMKWFYITGLLLKGSDFPEDHSARGLSGVLNVSLLWWHPIGFFTVIPDQYSVLRSIFRVFSSRV